jgi:hypothetical protein
VVSATSASRVGTHLGPQKGGVSDEFLIRRRWAEASAARPLRHRVRRRRASWRQAPSCRATRPDRGETSTVAHQGVWHARGNRATSGGVTPAVVRGHRLRRCVAPPSSVRGATRCWKEVGARVRRLSPFLIATAFQGGARSRNELTGRRDEVYYFTASFGTGWRLLGNIHDWS